MPIEQDCVHNQVMKCDYWKKQWDWEKSAMQKRSSRRRRYHGKFDGTYTVNRKQHGVYLINRKCFHEMCFWKLLRGEKGHPVAKFVLILDQKWFVLKFLIVSQRRGFVLDATDLVTCLCTSEVGDVPPCLLNRNALLPECIALLLTKTVNGRCGNDGSCGHNK